MSDQKKTQTTPCSRTAGCTRRIRHPGVCLTAPARGAPSLNAAATAATTRARAALAKLQNELTASPVASGRAGITWGDVADLERLAAALERAAGMDVSY